MYGFKFFSNCRAHSITGEFGFSNGMCATLNEMPTEFRQFYSAVAVIADKFQYAVEWDAPCFASLLVLQLFQVAPGWRILHTYMQKTLLRR